MKKVLTILLLALALGGCTSDGSSIFGFKPMHLDPHNHIYNER